jgi:thiol:disulfide interchange protein
MNTNTIKKCLLVFLALGLISCAKKEETKKYPEVKWVKFENYVNNSYKQPVFVNVTADWCVNCQYIEENVLETAEFKKYVEEKNVLAVEADVTQEENFNKVENWFNEVTKERFTGAQTYVVFDRGKTTVLQSQNDVLAFLWMSK